MKQTFRSIKGTFDILPDRYEIDGSVVEASAAWVELEQTIRNVLSRFLFAEIRPPMLEELAVFERGVGESTDIVSKEMFTVPRLRETYVLRPEITASVMRAYLQHRLDQRAGSQRLFYIGPCFRAERPQKGRFRQFHQFGAEFIGSSDARADAEIIAAMIAVYRALGISDGRLRLNSLGSPGARTRYKSALQAYLARYESDLSETSRQRLQSNPLRILDTKDERERKLLDEAPRLTGFLEPDDVAHFDRLTGFLDDLSIPFQIDPLLVRGLDYYSRTAFELESDELGAQSALAGGGRYDGLAEVLGSSVPVPGVGFAAGIERLFLALQSRGAHMAAQAKPDVFLVALGSTAERWSVRHAQELRDAHLSVAFDTLGRSMKAQMKEANRLGAAMAVIVGEQELETRTALVRDMRVGEQTSVPFDQLQDYVTRRIREGSSA